MKINLVLVGKHKIYLFSKKWPFLVIFEKIFYLKQIENKKKALLEPAGAKLKNKSKKWYF